MAQAFRIIGINPETNRQEKKRVYVSEADYIKYKDELIKRYKRYLNVKCQKLVAGGWKTIREVAYQGGSWRYKST